MLPELMFTLVLINKRSLTKIGTTKWGRSVVVKKLAKGLLNEANKTVTKND